MLVKGGPEDQLVTEPKTTLQDTLDENVNPGVPWQQV